MMSEEGLIGEGQGNAKNFVLPVEPEGNKAMSVKGEPESRSYGGFLSVMKNSFIDTSHDSMNLANLIQISHL
jgi:hypothetical protein